MRKNATSWLALFVCLPGFAIGQTARDPDNLARQVLAALTAKDRQALETLMIDKAEFKKFVWPTVATNVNGSGMNADKFYVMYAKSSNVGLAQHLSDYGGGRCNSSRWKRGRRRDTRHIGCCRTRKSRFGPMTGKSMFAPWQRVA